MVARESPLIEGVYGGFPRMGCTGVSPVFKGFSFRREPFDHCNRAYCRPT